MKTVMDSDNDPSANPTMFYMGDAPVITISLPLRGHTDLDTFVAQEFYRLNSTVPVLSPEVTAQIISAMKESKTYPLSDAALTFLGASFNENFYSPTYTANFIKCHK